jgi:predicted transglutaminase-like cysteine proteinase
VQLFIKYLFLILFIFFYSCTLKTVTLEKFQPSEILNLPITETRDNFVPYKEFCSNNPGECDLSGQTIIELTPEIWKQLLDINITVNRDIDLSLDKDQYQKEELWTYPSSGFGDCEDIALEKRFRLSMIGFPRGALRMAIGYHKKTLTSHAVLTVETKQGTYVMDSTNDQIHIWYQTPYNFETRERTDGKWERYDQDMWTFY